MMIRGTIHVGEAALLSNRVMAPLTGAPWPDIQARLIALPVVILGCGLVSALTASGTIAQDIGLACVFLIVAVAILGGTRVAQLLVRRNFRRALIKRGMPNPAAVTIELLPDVLQVRTPGSEMRTAWKAVSEVLLLGPYWFALAEAAPICIPRRWFASHIEERAFLAALIEKLDQSSRNRSAKALAYLKAEPKGV